MANVYHPCQFIRGSILKVKSGLNQRIVCEWLIAATCQVLVESSGYWHH